MDILDRLHMARLDYEEQRQAARTVREWAFYCNLLDALKLMIEWNAAYQNWLATRDARWIGIMELARYELTGY